MITVSFETDEQAHQIIVQKQSEGYRLVEWLDQHDGRRLIFESVEPEVNVEVTITGGDGMDPPGVALYDPNGLQIEFTLQMNGQIVPVDGLWRVPIRDADGRMADMVSVNVRSGRGTIAYKPLSVGLFEIREDDLDHVKAPDGTDLVVKLARPVRIKAYR